MLDNQSNNDFICYIHDDRVENLEFSSFMKLRKIAIFEPLQRKLRITL